MAPGKRRSRTAVPSGAVGLAGAAGVVAAAAAAHVAAGAALPAPALLAFLVVALTGLTRLVARLPAAARSVRVRLAVAVALQPLLHGLFDRVDGRSDATSAMLLAHLGAGLFAAWWLARGAERVVVALGAVCRPLLLPRIVPDIDAGRIVESLLPAPRPHHHLATMRRRGPPVASLTRS